ncbi:unnamed protein product [Bursaphelenchus xylophilus]|uniref:(pine wood nematode) hypothetical protein n=1 Tax=Bursaphelenchus xylophilus TaxID=6326 RepID=A0A1I7RPQ5_BURXY|nr:unnamed protein product [Bursaphelenchus xylophilus]CAG9096445.1 unnamed protein product [Bursaphelenchus xylophilus]
MYTLLFSIWLLLVVNVDSRTTQTRVEYVPPTIFQVGTGKGYYKAADLFKSSINNTVDPCDDFFEYACGTWISNNSIPKDLTSYGHFSELREKVNKEMKDLYESPAKSSSSAINKLKLFYKACMDTDNLNKLRSGKLLEQIKDFGYWPILWPEEWRKADFDITQTLINFGLSRALDVFVDVYVSHDQKNVSRRILHFDQGGLGLGSSARDYYLNETKYAKQLNAYENYINGKLALLAEDAGVNRSKEAIAADVKEIIAFEKEFAHILVSEDDRRNYTRMYNMRKLSDLKTLMPLIDWQRYFYALMPKDMYDYLQTDPDVIINEIEFFNRLSELIQKTDLKVIANYMFWRFTSGWSLQLDERFEDVTQEFMKQFVGKQTKSPRWKDCESAVNSRLNYASGAMYVREFFKDDDRKAAQDMVKDLREAFRTMLKDNDWMKDETKAYALKKADEMQALIGYPDFVFNDTELDDYYGKLNTSETDGYADLIKDYSIWAQHKAFRRLKEEVDRAEFGTSSAVVNAFYSSVKNGITFPAAILQAPFFDATFPKAVNYGGIGSVIGHEITHGFDDTGSQFDAVGNLHNWWDNETEARFKNLTQCIVDQYGSYEVEGTGLKINGILTQGENIADNGGIRQAYRAYRNYIRKLGHEEKRLPGFEEYTNNQIFYISYAQSWCGHAKPEATVRQLIIDPHSPMRFRVNGVVSNQPEFASAFSCSAGSPMNPKKRCVVW